MPVPVPVRRGVQFKLPFSCHSRAQTTNLWQVLYINDKYASAPSFQCASHAPTHPLRHTCECIHVCIYLYLFSVSFELSCRRAGCAYRLSKASDYGNRNNNNATANGMHNYLSPRFSASVCVCVCGIEIKPQNARL